MRKRELTFRELTRDMKADDPKYLELEKEFRAAEEKKAKEAQRKDLLVKRALHLLQCVRGMNYTKLSHIEEEKLIRIGKALRKIVDELEDTDYIFDSL